MKIYGFLCLFTGRPWVFPHLFVTLGEIPIVIDSDPLLRVSSSWNPGCTGGSPSSLDDFWGYLHDFGNIHDWNISTMWNKKTGEKNIYFFWKIYIYICIYIYMYIYIWTKMENISIDIHRIWKTSVGSSPFYAAQRDDVSGLRLRALASLDWAPWSSLSITAFWKSLEDVGNIYIYIHIYSIYIHIYI